MQISSIVTSHDNSVNIPKFVFFFFGGGDVSAKQKVPGTQFFAWINKKNSNKNIGYMKLISEVIRMIFLAKN